MILELAAKLYDFQLSSHVFSLKLGPAPTSGVSLTLFQHHKLGIHPLLSKCESRLRRAPKLYNNCSL
jgi:hypothetical protein